MTEKRRDDMRPLTAPALTEMKQRREKIVALTAYDYPTAKMLDEAGVDVILVGDSLGMIVLGHDDTLSVTMEDMIRHTAAAVRGSSRSLVIGDMPFMSYQASPEDALRNAGRFLSEAGAHGVKLEGGGSQITKTVARMVDAGIPVMGHLGLTPQSIRQFGGYRVQGKKESAAEQILADALALEAAGAFALVIEVIPEELAGRISESVSIPVIGIGAGGRCDGQVLVTHDLLGLWDRFTPKFVRRYAELGSLSSQAVSEFKDDVKNGRFPSGE